MPLFQKLGIKLAGCDGSGYPEITDEMINFNGLEKCGHEHRNLGIAWPADNASGVCFAYQKGESVSKQTTLLAAIQSAGFSVGEPEPLALGDSDVSGEWYAGCKLLTRTCGGDCSHEPLYLPLKLDKEDIEFKERVRKQNTKKMYFEFCKTAYKPYDLAVICALIIARHHLGSKYIMVRSDGNRDKWADGRQLCQIALGYGEDFHFEIK